MSYLLKLVYATMSLTWSFLEIKWIKYSGEIFTSNYIPRKLSANQLIPQMLCDRDKNVILLIAKKPHAGDK